MLDAPCDVRYHMGVRGIRCPHVIFDNLVKKLETYHCKPTSNIDICPSTLAFVENIGHKYDFQGGWGGLK